MRRPRSVRRAAPEPDPGHPLDDLLQRASAGDVHAFAELYDATSSQLYAIALTALPDPVQASRATEHAYLLAWRYSARHDRRRSGALPWITAILQGVAAASRQAPATGRDTPPAGGATERLDPLG